MPQNQGTDVQMFQLSETEQVMLMRLVNASYEQEMPANDDGGTWEIRPLGLMLTAKEHDALESLFNKICLGF